VQWLGTDQTNVYEQYHRYTELRDAHLLQITSVKDGREELIDIWNAVCCTMCAAASRLQQESLAAFKFIKGYTRNKAMEFLLDRNLLEKLRQEPISKEFSFVKKLRRGQIVVDTSNSPTSDSARRLLTASVGT
jgi:hypothetical protein